MKNTLTKDGLTGNSGFGALGMFHISANYSAGENHVFVECFEDGDPVPTWKRTTAKQAKRKKLNIIKCAHCNAPAISLDHFWPYYSEQNYCAKHRGKS